jgi:hypothetical protein
MGFDSYDLITGLVTQQVVPAVLLLPPGSHRFIEIKAIVKRWPYRFLEIPVVRSLYGFHPFAYKVTKR